MSRTNGYERSTISSKARELATLSIFIAVIAVISVVIIDPIVYPVSLFAIENKKVFNYIIKDISFFVILALLAILMLKKILFLRKHGLGGKEILKYLVTKPAMKISAFLLTIFFSAAVILVIYILFSANYRLIYRFSGN